MGVTAKETTNDHAQVSNGMALLLFATSSASAIYVVGKKGSEERQEDCQMQYGVCYKGCDGVTLEKACFADCERFLEACLSEPDPSSATSARTHLSWSKSPHHLGTFRQDPICRPLHLPTESSARLLATHRTSPLGCPMCRCQSIAVTASDSW